MPWVRFLKRIASCNRAILVLTLKGLPNSTSAGTHVFSDADPDVPVVLEREVVEEDILVAAAGHGDLGVARLLASVLRLLPRLVTVQPLQKRVEERLS